MLTTYLSETTNTYPLVKIALKNYHTKISKDSLTKMVLLSILRQFLLIVCIFQIKIFQLKLSIFSLSRVLNLNFRTQAC